MRRSSVYWMAAFCGLAVFTASGQRGSAQQPSGASQSGTVTPRAELYPTLDDAFLRWPLPPGAERYGAIDGRRMHKDVVEQARISRRYRDAGHPKFWGRITGTSSDAESAQWLAAKFKAAGLSDVRIQPLDLEPQWMPQAWEAVITGGGKTIRIESAQPFYGANALPAGGIDVEAVYAGLGSEADFAGKNVTGKAVFVFNQTGLRDEGAVRRADSKARLSCSKWTCCPATCATRRIRQARTHRHSPLGATMATRRAISLSAFYEKYWNFHNSLSR
jgi:hypothetical protein